MRSLLMMAIFNSRLASRLVRAPALRVLLGSRILPSVATRRNDSIFTKYREPPNGFLFNEKPLKPGEKRKWEDWEAIWYVGWGVTFTLLILGAIYRPEPELFKEAKAEAERRLADFDAADAAEQGETGDNAVLKTVEADDFEDDDS